MTRTYRERTSAGRPRQVRGGCALAIEAEGGDAKRLRSRERGPRLARERLLAVAGAARLPAGAWLPGSRRARVKSTPLGDALRGECIASFRAADTRKAR